MDTAAIVSKRTVLLASADALLRQRLNLSLSGLRWQVREAGGGAEALAQLEDNPTEALILDDWLPDLEVMEFAGHLQALYPGMEMLRVDGDPIVGAARSPRRNELLHALREALELSHRRAATSDAGQLAVLDDVSDAPSKGFSTALPRAELATEEDSVVSARRIYAPTAGALLSMVIDDMVGDSAEMLELARMIRLVAPRSASVLIEGETGTGKELVARAVHRLSPRAHKPFVVLNCAAIPESLLEAELFGHTRGAFTGALQSRTGRIEAAHGGTLFLDEIGEMPIGLQAKILRFLENGELQRVGDNDVMHVDVRVIAATHQQLEKRVADGTFRLDLYHRLAVFPIEVPPLRDRSQDIAALSEHFLALMGKSATRKTLSAAALAKLRLHDWPGTVRELAHVLERGSILAEDSPRIRPEDIRMRRTPRM
jgi:transcriptional regulator with GAF, ATPase, and Fis domain